MLREVLKNMSKPKWDGSPTSWKQFWLQWKLYWRTSKSLVGQENKGLFFLEFLPKQPYDWQGHFRALITERGWTFKEMATFLQQQYDVMVPDWQKLHDWKNCMPQGKSYMDYLSWYLTWERLGADCSISEEEWILQFNIAMNHQGYFIKYLKGIVEAEITYHYKMNLADRANFVLNSLRITHQAVMQVTHSSPHGVGTPKVFKPKAAAYASGKFNPNIVCYKCKQKGHLAWKCPMGLASQGRDSSSSAKPSVSFQGRGYRSFDKASSSPATKPYVSSTQRSSFGKGKGQPSYGKGSGKSYPAKGSGLPDKAIQDARRKEGKCLMCGQTGHGWRDCPSDLKKQRSHPASRHVSKAPKGGKGGPSRGKSAQSPSRFYPFKGSSKVPQGKSYGKTPIRSMNAEDSFTADVPVETFSSELDFDEFSDEALDMMELQLNEEDENPDWGEYDEMAEAMEYDEEEEEEEAPGLEAPSDED